MYAWIRGYHLMHTWWKWEIKFIRFPGLDPVKHQNSCWLLQTIHMWLVKGKELSTQSQDQCQHLLTGKPCTSDRAYLAPGLLSLGFFTVTKCFQEETRTFSRLWMHLVYLCTFPYGTALLIHPPSWGWHPTAAVRDGSRLGSSIFIWPVGF